MEFDEKWQLLYIQGCVSIQDRIVLDNLSDSSRKELILLYDEELEKLLGDNKDFYRDNISIYPYYENSLDNGNVNTFIGFRLYFDSEDVLEGLFTYIPAGYDIELAEDEVGMSVVVKKKLS